MQVEKKEKICIVTFYGSTNYGSNLQAIGLAGALTKMGYEVAFLKDFKVKSFILRHPRLVYARIINRINNKKKQAFFNPIPYTISDARKNRLKAFNEKTFPTISFISSSVWKKAIEEKLTFVSGSDIIWNPARGYPSKFFLDFAYYAGLKRFSYASSIGAPSLPRKYYSAYKKYLGTMCKIGVREQSVADMLQPIIDKHIVKVVDPSLLLNKDEWEKYVQDAQISIPISNTGFILSYFVMEDKRYWKYIDKIRASTGLQVITLPMHHSDEKQPYDIILDGTPCEFLWLIKNAELICTDSFHMCAFSLIFQKEFYLLNRVRKSEDAKYDDFLNRYHLYDRRVNCEDIFIRRNKINYQFAINQLEKDRIESIEFLHRALKN